MKPLKDNREQLSRREFLASLLRRVGYVAAGTVTGTLAVDAAREAGLATSPTSSFSEGDYAGV